MKTKMTENELREMFQQQINNIDCRIGELQDTVEYLDDTKVKLRDILGRIIYENYEETSDVSHTFHTNM